jgi:hypothetical protein
VPVTRPRRFLDVPVAVYRIPLLGVVGQRQTVLEAAAADKVAGRFTLDHEVVPLCRTDVDVCRVYTCLVADLVASVVDDAQFPLRRWVCEFKPVGC